MKHYTTRYTFDTENGKHYEITSDYVDDATALKRDILKKGEKIVEEHQFSAGEWYDEAD